MCLTACGTGSKPVQIKVFRMLLWLFLFSSQQEWGIKVLWAPFSIFIHITYLLSFFLLYRWRVHFSFLDSFTETGQSCSVWILAALSAKENVLFCFLLLLLLFHAEDEYKDYDNSRWAAGNDHTEMFVIFTAFHQLFPVFPCFPFHTFLCWCLFSQLFWACCIPFIPFSWCRKSVINMKSFFPNESIYWYIFLFQDFKDFLCILLNFYCASIFLCAFFWDRILICKLSQTLIHLKPKFALSSQRSSCISLPIAGFIGLCHDARLCNIF